MELSVTRKNNIIQIADVVSATFWTNEGVDVAGICQDEEILLIEDDYKDYFDGMIVWDGNRFFIHLNTARGNFIQSTRGRFTLGHELGHYFIESHRENIRSGKLAPHASHTSLVHSDQLESEADYFASTLLMPSARLRQVSGGKKFSLDIIREISIKFNVSLTAALLRFAEVGTHEIMVVFTQDSIVKWSFRSHDFPKLANRFSIGGTVPPTSVAGESFTSSSAKYTGVEEVDLEDWFIYKTWDPGRQLYEQCFYSELNNYVVSIVWFK